jgi:hypothetical protein
MNESEFGIHVEINLNSLPRKKRGRNRKRKESDERSTAQSSSKSNIIVDENSGDYCLPIGTSSVSSSTTSDADKIFTPYFPSPISRNFENEKPRHFNFRSSPSSTPSSSSSFAGFSSSSTPSSIPELFPLLKKKKKTENDKQVLRTFEGKIVKQCVEKMFNGQEVTSSSSGAIVTPMIPLPEGKKKREKDKEKQKKEKKKKEKQKEEKEKGVMYNKKYPKNNLIYHFTKGEEKKEINIVK